MSDKPIRVAVLDLYNNVPNEGMRCIRSLLGRSNLKYRQQIVLFDVFDVRYREEVPDLSYDLYISTGGPGSPYDGEGKRWETRYFDLLEGLWLHNQQPEVSRKHGLFICHSFQMMSRFFGLGDVVRRRSPAFGIFAVHKAPAGRREPLFYGLADPFYAVDFRTWQVVQPSVARLSELQAEIISLEKIRPHVELERAVMGIRLSPELVGFQFHPEADAVGMKPFFMDPARKEEIIRDHGEAKYHEILDRLTDPNYIQRTHETVLPNFLRNAIARLRPEPAET